MGDIISQKPTVNTHRKGMMIVCMLLNHLPPASLLTPASLGLAAFQSTASNIKASAFDACHTPSPLGYFAHIRHLNLELWFFDLTYSFLVSEPLNSEAAE